MLAQLNGDGEAVAAMDSQFELLQCVQNLQGAGATRYSPKRPGADCRVSDFEPDRQVRNT
jgi:hypothetical protein